MRRAPVAIALALWAGVVSHPARTEAPSTARGPSSAAIPIASPSEPAALPTAAWAHALPALSIYDANTTKTGEVRLYRDDGALDEEAARAFDRIVDDGKHGAPRPLARRLLALLVKAAAHFNAKNVSVVSSYRDSKRSGSRHRTGEAIDFDLDGVPAAKLAQHLRTYGRVGVGIYTNPRTQFVHLDVRDESFHWLDASPPGRTWRERELPIAKRPHAMRLGAPS